jgi:hypothetical protein
MSLTDHDVLEALYKGTLLLKLKKLRALGFIEGPLPVSLRVTEDGRAEMNLSRGVDDAAETERLGKIYAAMGVKGVERYLRIQELAASWGDINAPPPPELYEECVAAGTWPLGISKEMAEDWWKQKRERDAEKALR